MLKLRWNMRRRARDLDHPERLDVYDLLLPIGPPLDWPASLHHLIRGMVEHLRGRQDIAFQIFGQAPDDTRLLERDLPLEVAGLLRRHHTIGSALLALAQRAHQQGPMFPNRLRWLERMDPALFLLLNSVGRALVPTALIPVYAHHAAELAYGQPLPETPSHAVEQFRTLGRVLAPVPLLDAPSASDSSSKDDPDTVREPNGQTV